MNHSVNGRIFHEFNPAKDENKEGGNDFDGGFSVGKFRGVDQYIKKTCD